MMTTERACAYVDLSAIEYNYSSIKSYLPDRVKILCVVKADAYGHGSFETAKRLESLGAGYLGVATVNEGMELRNGGIKAPILVMSGILTKNDIDYTYKNSLTPVVYDIEGLRELREESLKHKDKYRIHLKLDTGMGRLGFMPRELPSVINEIKSSSRIVVEGFMSHFAASEYRDKYGFKQITIFKKSLELLRNNGIEPELVHMANSGAVVTYPEAHFDMVRAGISLYGSYPDKEMSKELSLKPVMKFVSKIVTIKKFPPNSSLSYDRTFITKRNTKIACVPVGYADGYPRALSNKGEVLIKDKRFNVVGRICMDWLLVDITDEDSILAGDEVILLGRGVGDAITADEIAEKTGTIPYEILCKISKRVPRVYI